MQKIRPLILVAAMLAAGSVTAATVGITIDGGGETSYTLGSLSVDSSGNATVVAVSNGNPPPASYTVTINQGTGGTISGTSGSVAAGTSETWTAAPATGYTFGSWGGACAGTAGTSCTKTVNSALTVSATFVADGGGVVVDGNCPAVDPKVTVVETNVSGGYLTRTDVKNVVPERVYAYKFKTQNVASVGNWIAAVSTSSTSGKLVKITQCPGVMEVPPGTTGACERWTAESTRIDYVVNRSDLSTRTNCHLQPNTVYYANIVSKANLTDTNYEATGTAYNCGSKVVTAGAPNCAYTIQGE